MQLHNACCAVLCCVQDHQECVHLCLRRPGCHAQCGAATLAGGRRGGAQRGWQRRWVCQGRQGRHCQRGSHPGPAAAGPGSAGAGAGSQGECPALQLVPTACAPAAGATAYPQRLPPSSSACASAGRRSHAAADGPAGRPCPAGDAAQAVGPGGGTTGSGGTAAASHSCCASRRGSRRRSCGPAAACGECSARA